jgi:hypothetical protein
VVYLGVVSVRELVSIAGLMNSEAYLTILNGNLQQSAHQQRPRSKPAFQEHNNLKLTAWIFTTFLQKKKVEKVP